MHPHAHAFAAGLRDTPPRKRKPARRVTITPARKGLWKKVSGVITTTAIFKQIRDQQRNVAKVGRAWLVPWHRTSAAT